MNALILYVPIKTETFCGTPWRTWRSSSSSGELAVEVLLAAFFAVGSVGGTWAKRQEQGEDDQYYGCCCYLRRGHGRPRCHDDVRRSLERERECCCFVVGCCYCCGMWGQACERENLPQVARYLRLEGSKKFI